MAERKFTFPPKLEVKDCTLSLCGDGRTYEVRDGQTIIWITVKIDCVKDCERDMEIPYGISIENIIGDKNHDLPIGDFKKAIWACFRNES